MFSLAIYCFIFIDFARHGATREKVASYAGAQVWRTDLKSEEDALYFTALAEQQAISIWNLNSKSVDFMIHPADQVKVKRVLRARDLTSSTIIQDVQVMIDELKPAPSLWNPKALRNGHRLDWNNYPRLNIIDEYLIHLANTYSSLVTLRTIGNSVENRPIKMLRISNGGKQNKAILMTAGLHAREWISITSALYLIDTIVTKFIHLPYYMRNIDWSIIPVVNPDGYEYTHTNDRLWRKNRQRMKKECLGVDLNRNFGYDWYMPGLARNSCKNFEQYSGPEQFSEPETRAIRDLVQTSKTLPIAFIDVHSYGQLIMYPWGSKPNLPMNNEILNATASAMSQAIFNATGKQYTIGNIYHTVYRTSGTQVDWFLSLGVNYSFVFELRDKSKFLLPPEYIVPTGSDFVAAIKRYDWYVPGLAQNSCDTFEQYSGFEPFSEPETRAIRDVVLTAKKLPEVFIDLHSYGQLIMYPWGSKPDLPQYNNLLKATSSAMTQAIFKATGENYTVGNIYHTVYPTSGVQIDWFLSLGLHHSYILELRDRRVIGYAERGFLLLPEHIKPTGRDLLAAMNKLTEVLDRNIDIELNKQNQPHKLTAAKSNIENQLTKESAEKMNKEKQDLENSAVKTNKGMKHKKGKDKKNKKNLLRKESTEKMEKQLTKEKGRKTTTKINLTKKSARKTKKEKHVAKESDETVQSKEKQPIDLIDRKSNKQVTFKKLEPGADIEDFSINVSVTLNVENGYHDNGHHKLYVTNI